MSLSLLQGYSSPEEEEEYKQPYLTSDEEDEDADLHSRNDHVSGNDINKPLFDPPNPSASSSLPSALDAFSEISRPPQFLNNSVGESASTDKANDGQLWRHGHRRNRRDKNDMPAGAVLQAKAQLVGIRDRVSSDASNASLTESGGSAKRVMTATNPNAEDAADLLRMCVQCGIPKTFSNAHAKYCYNLMSSAGISTARQSYGADGRTSGRIFADYTIFKGKAALSAAPVLPTFSKMDSGYTKVGRRGVIMLSFRPAIGERKYDSEKKQLFALSVTEVGSVISLGPGDSCEFYHDPSIQSRDAGQVRKSLSIKPHTDGYFISLSVTNNISKTNERFTVPVTTAEFAVMRAAFSYALPHIMGWAHSTNPSTTGVGKDLLKVHLPLAAADEWDK